MLLLVLAWITGGLAALLVLFVILALYLSRPPAKQTGIYIVPRPSGLSGIFAQHAPLLSADESKGRGLFDFFLEQAQAARDHGKDAFFICLTFMAPRVILIRPKDVHHVLVTNASNYVKSDSPYAQSEIFFGGPSSLVATRDEALHTRIKRAVSPFFTPKVLNRIAQTSLMTHVDQLCEKVAEEFSCGGVQAAGDKNTNHAHNTNDNRNTNDNLDELVHHFALSTIAESGFRQNKKKNNNNNNNRDSTTAASGEETVAQDFEHLTSLLGKHFQLFVLPMTIRNVLIRISSKVKSAFDTVQIAADKIQDKAMSMVRETRRSIEKEEEGSSNNNKEAEKMTMLNQDAGDDTQTLVDILAFGKIPQDFKDESEIGAQALTFLMAAHDTTRSVIMWTCHLLAHHPRVQDILFDELSQTLPTTAAPPSSSSTTTTTSRIVPNLDDIKDLPYLNGVIREALRLHAPVPHAPRKALRDDKLPSGVVIPAGTILSVPPLIIHHAPEIYGDDDEPSLFRPERWVENNGALYEKVRTCSAWIPFLVGNRQCIGKDYALNMLLVTIAALVREFEIEAGGQQHGGKKRFPKKVMGVTVQPESKIPLKITKRRLD